MPYLVVVADVISAVEIVSLTWLLLMFLLSRLYDLPGCCCNYCCCFCCSDCMTYLVVVVVIVVVVSVVQIVVDVVGNVDHPVHH
jgi:hypothetical protein